MRPREGGGRPRPCGSLVGAALAAALTTPLALSCAAARPAAERGFLLRELQVGERTYLYALYVPRAYSADRAWPLVVFLHGRGESGTDGSRQLAQGLPSAVQWDAARWPTLVLAPQKPDEDSEWEQHEAAVMAILELVRQEYRVDSERIALTGISQGGHGTWVLGARHPELWSALVPVCGYAGARHGAAGPGLAPPFEGGPEELAAPLAGVPVWAFHGEDDDIVPAAETRAMAAAITAAGGTVEATVYPGVNHGSWDRAYREERLPAFLLAPRRGRR